MKDVTIVVGTVGQSIMRSEDDGKTWARIGPRHGFAYEASVRCIAMHPRQPNILFAGTEKGLYRSEDAGANWQFVDSALNSCSSSIRRSIPTISGHWPSIRSIRKSYLREAARRRRRPYFALPMAESTGRSGRRRSLRSARTLAHRELPASLSTRWSRKISG